MAHIQEITVPDIGGAENVDVIEILVKPGDVVAREDPLITLEGDKATMDVPVTTAGKVRELKINVGDKVSEGSLILLLETAEAAAATPQKAVSADVLSSPQQVKQSESEQPAAASLPETDGVGTAVHAGPAVRRIAREFGIDLTRIAGSGEKNRIVKEDLQQYVKAKLSAVAVAGSDGIALTPAPVVDFTKFGAVETKPLSKIQKLSGANLHRNWVTIPHVTQFGEADITELEAFRQQQKKIAEKQGLRLTPLVFMMKAAVAALQNFPHFNASLDSSGQQLVIKKYFHIGVAVDTPNGLVVPVIRDVDQKGLLDLACELGAISSKAREKGLSITEMQGGCFSISSLGGIGGTAFTPIINAPEVAILGVSRTETRPVYVDGVLQPRLMLPLSLSYDHRVIDGADAARFLVYLAECLRDIRNLLL